MPTATAAQAPVPHARVSPAPRSKDAQADGTARHDLQIASVDALGEARVRRDARALRGHRGRHRRRRRAAPRAGCPSRRRRHRRSARRSAPAARAATRRRNAVLPMRRCRTADGPDRSPVRPCRRWTRPSSCRRSTRRRFIVSTTSVVFSLRCLSRTKRTKQRAPLPQCSTSSPVPPLEDAVAEIDAGAERGLDDEDLVGTDAEAAVGECLQLRGAEGERLARPRRARRSRCPRPASW